MHPEFSVQIDGGTMIVLSHFPPNLEQGDIATFPPAVRMLTNPRTLRPDNRR